MNNLKIQLKTDRQIYHDLYFRDSYATFPLYAKNHIRAAIASGLLVVIVGIAEIQNHSDVALYIFAGAALLLLIFLIRLLKKWRLYAKWKKPLDAYINTIAGYRSYVLDVSEVSVEHIINGASFIEKWDRFTQCSILPDYVAIGDAATPNKYLFPAKAMRPNEYEQLKLFVRSMIDKA